jgi:hypothetical protein
MAKSKSKSAKVVETIKENVIKKVHEKVLLRDASTGAFFEGKKPGITISPSGNRGGVPFWEVTR